MRVVVVFDGGAPTLTTVDSFWMLSDDMGTISKACDSDVDDWGFDCEVEAYPHYKMDM